MTRTLEPIAEPALTRSADGRAGAGPSSRRWLVWLLAFLALASVLRLPAFFVDVFNSDETFLATQARVINDGGDLYEDAADRKPPVVPYLYALAFRITGSEGLWSARILAMVAVALTATLLASEARRRYGARAGWWAGALFVLASVAFAPQDGQAANFEIFMLPAMTAAVVLAARGHAGASGVSVALAALAKQTGAATLLPVLYLVWRHKGARGLRAAVLGFATPVALVALAVGPGDLLFWAVLGNGSYFGLGAASAYVAGLFAVMTFAFVACNGPIVWTLPRAWREREPGVDTDLWLWLLSGAVSVAVGLRFFGHYYLQLLPPLALLSAGALTRRSAQAVRVTLACSTVIALGCCALGFFVKPWSDEPRYQTVSRFLEVRTSPEDSIFVWGHMPEIYWASGTLPGSRYLSSGFPVGDWGSRPEGDPSTNAPTPGAYEQMLEDLRVNRPKFVLDTAPAAFRGSQYAPMRDFPELDAFVRSRYRYTQTIDGIAVYERRARIQVAARPQG